LIEIGFTGGGYGEVAHIIAAHVLAQAGISVRQANHQRIRAMIPSLNDIAKSFGKGFINTNTVEVLELTGILEKLLSK